MSHTHRYVTEERPQPPLASRTGLRSLTPLEVSVASEKEPKGKRSLDEEHPLWPDAREAGSVPATPLSGLKRDGGVTSGGDPQVIAGVHEGQVLAGKYRVERVLGVGGMGVVVAADSMRNRTASPRTFWPGRVKTLQTRVLPIRTAG